MSALLRYEAAPAPVVRIKTSYGYEARKTLIIEFRRVVSRIRGESPMRLSIERLHKLVGEYVASHDFLVSLDGMTPREENIADMICHKTFGKLLSCPIDIRIDRMHPKPFRFVEAFVSLDAIEPMRLA
jgi:hypothetical protein